jgi:transcriptional regulator
MASTKAKKPEIDLILSVLCIVTPKGCTYNQSELAELCQCARNNIYEIEHRALRKARVILARKNINFTDLLEA